MGHYRAIVDLMMSNVSRQLGEKEIKLEVTDIAKDFLGEKGYDEVYGARPLRRVIQNMIEDRLSEAVLREEFKVFDRIFEIKADPKKQEIVESALKAIKELPDVLAVEKRGDEIVMFANKSRKFEVEKVIKDLLKETKDEAEAKLKDWEKPHIEENSYVSYVVIDLKDTEIAVESRDKFPVPKTPVGAGTG